MLQYKYSRLLYLAEWHWMSILFVCPQFGQIKSTHLFFASIHSQSFAVYRVIVLSLPPHSWGNLGVDPKRSLHLLYGFALSI